MQSMNISLPEPLKQFVDGQIAEGRYSSVSEYVRELIRANEKRKAEERLEALFLESLQAEESAMTPNEWKAIRQDAIARVKVRRRARLAGLPVSYVVGDAMDPGAARAALEGKHVGAILETLQFAPGDGRSWAKVYGNFVPWAKRTGVKQFIVLGGGCSDREAKECPLSPPLYAMTRDMTRAEHILRDSGVPYTIIRVGALLPNPRHPKFDWETGRSYLTTDVTKFGGVMRTDLNEQVLGCIRAKRCLNRIFVIDDPTLKPQVDHFICKRRHETDTVSGLHPECGPMPDFTDAYPPKDPP